MQSTVFRHTRRKAACFIYGSRGETKCNRVSRGKDASPPVLPSEKLVLRVPSRFTRVACRVDASHDGRSARWSAYGTTGGHRARSEGATKCRTPLDNTACATHSPLPLFQEQVFGARAWVSIRNLILRRVHARFLERMCVANSFVACRVRWDTASCVSVHHSVVVWDTVS